jgi:hypothetical protein
MGRRRQSDLAPFTRWLEEVRGVSPSTSSAYGSRIRRMLDALPVVDRAHLDALLLEDGFVDYPATFKTAWKSFVLFSADKGVTLPTPTPSAVAQQQHYAIPDAVADDLLYILQTTDLTRAHLGALTWQDVDLAVKGDKVWVAVPGDPGSYVAALERPIRRVIDWAQPEGPLPESPWVPESPGSSQPMPVKVIRKLLARRKRTRRRPSDA